MNQVLENHAIFDKKTVMATLKALANLIDWNEIQLFDGCRAKINEFLRVKHLRAGAFQCLSAIVGKGMAELDKLTIIHQTGYGDEIKNSALTLLNDYEKNHDTEGYDEEKTYMKVVSLSICQIGKWCLNVK